MISAFRPMRILILVYSHVGVQIVRDVEPYETMKQTLLNGSHSALAYPAHLLGYTGVADAMADPDLRRFIRDYYAITITISTYSRT